MAHGRRTRQEGQRDQRERRILALLAEIVDPGFTHRELAPRVGAAASTVYQDLDGINPSDLLIVRPQPPRHLRDGEVVVAVRDQDTDSAGLTLKRWHRERGGRIRLQPAHRALGGEPDDERYHPLYYDRADVQVCGRLLGVICPTGGGRGRFPRI